MRILLVEDDSMIAQAVVGSLKDDGYAVDWVNNGNTAETTLAGQNYDIILLDLGLPGQDGIQVLQHARATHNTTPILILTARDDIQSRLAGLDGGADDYIIKPFIMAELKARIRAILRRHAGQASPLLCNGSIQLNPQTYQATLDGQPEIRRAASPDEPRRHHPIPQRAGRQNLRLGRRSGKQRHRFSDSQPAQENRQRAY